ncbi:unnamed protein product, partial [Porites lobata]
MDTPVNDLQAVSSDSEVEIANAALNLTADVPCHDDTDSDYHTALCRGGVTFVNKMDQFIWRAQSVCYTMHNIIVMLYYALIYPFLTYGIIICGNAYKTTLQ